MYISYTYMCIYISFAYVYLYISLHLYLSFSLSLYIYIYICISILIYLSIYLATVWLKRQNGKQETQNNKHSAKTAKRQNTETGDGERPKRKAKLGRMEIMLAGTTLAD